MAPQTTNEPVASREIRRRALASLGRVRQLRRDEQGAAVVEFALIIPVFILIVFALVDFGRALWMQNVVVAALREGARAAAVVVDPSTSSPPTSTMTSVAQTKVATYISNTIGTTFNTSDVSVTYCTGGNATAPCGGASTDGLIMVRLAMTISGSATTDTYPFTPITPIATRLGLNQIRVLPAAFRWESAP
jgi:Flp pilus assembly protein TadG